MAWEDKNCKNELNLLFRDYRDRKGGGGGHIQWIQNIYFCKLNLN